VLVAAIRSPTGASMALLDSALNGRFEILVSTPLMLEYEAVLTRDEHLNVSELALDDVGRILDSICRQAIEVKIHWNWRPQLQDEDDEMVLEAAINGHAEAIVTFNRADFERSAKLFGIAVLSPSEGLERVGLQ
jgi:predicted nucleic acid-binding protein